MVLMLPILLLAQENQEGRYFIGVSADIQRAISLSGLKVGNLLHEKHVLKETLAGGELRLGYISDSTSRFYLALESAHQKRGLKYYGGLVEYNYTPYLNRYWRGLLGVGLGYSLASLDEDNVRIEKQSPGKLQFDGASYMLKGGVLFRYNRNIELEIALKARHAVLGKSMGNITIQGAQQPVVLNMNKTFTFGGGIGLNFKF